MSGSDPDGVRVFRGDRDRPDGLQALDGQTFDVVVDTTSMDVGRVQRAVEALGPRTGRFVLTSTVSVYSDFSEVGITEESPTFGPRWPGTATPVDPVEEYGASNVACEAAVLDAVGEHGPVSAPVSCTASSQGGCGCNERGGVGTRVQPTARFSDARGPIRSIRDETARDPS